MNNFTQIGDFHGERAKGVGSSDIPVLMGLTKHYSGGGIKTPLDLWEAKTGRSERWSGNQKTFFGNELEPIICGAFIGRHFKDYKAGRRVKIDKIMERALTQIDDIGTVHHTTECRMPEYPWAIAHVDMIITTGDNLDPFIVEAKSHSFFAARRKDDPNKGYEHKSNTADDIPLSIRCQIQWQMMCYDIPSAYVAPLIDTNDFRIYGPIKSQPRQQEKMLARGKLFWDCVVADQPPKPETWGDVLKIFPDMTGETVIISGEILDGALKIKDEAKHERAKKSKTDKKLKELQTAMGLLLQGGDVLSDMEGKQIASRSCYNRENLSLKDLVDHGWIYSRVKKYIKSITINKLNF